MTHTTPSTVISPADIGRIRDQFPALASKTVFLENAGGSQVPRGVADAIRSYMLESYVQLGAGYTIADRCDRVIAGAHEFVERLVNATGGGRVILGPSSTQLVTMLAGCCAETMSPGDEVIVTETGHETNVGPWAKLAVHGVEVRHWRVDPVTLRCPLEALEALLTPRTRIVAVVHVSNLLGEIVDVAEIADLVHRTSPRARVVVDGVAYAPHRVIDVTGWNVDWYVYSTYKVYGPHAAALYGSHEALAELRGPNHFFIPHDDVPYVFELGGVNHEACAGLLALDGYLRFLAGLADHGRGGGAEAGPCDRPALEAAFDVMRACELPLQRRLVEYLIGKSGVRIVGPAHGDGDRVGTISFVHDRLASKEIAAAAHARDIGIRNGHMYAYRLCEALGIDPEDGVVRVSLVHYNTMQEIERLIEVLEGIL